MNRYFPHNWRVVKLKELGEVNRGRSRHRPRYAAHLYGGRYPFIQTGDIKESKGRITTFQQTYSEAGLAQSRLWPINTMCITIAANIAETGILTFPACFPDSVVGFIANQSICDVYFVEYMFRYLKRKIQHQASGSVQDNINIQTLDELDFYLPPLGEQKAITHILSTLDDKIALNQKMNRTLEEMARAIFKSWFVDFDPVKAKMEGRQPVGMDAETAALFPHEFEESALGAIPKGWKIQPLDEVTSYLKRGIQPIYLDTNGVLVLNQKCIRDYHIDISNARRHDNEKKSIKGREIKIGDVLVNSTGVGTLGRIAQVLAIEETTIVDSHVTIIRANSELLTWNTLGLLIYNRQSEIEELGEGSTGQTELSRTHLGALKIIIPPLSIQKVFDEKVLILRKTTTLNDYQIRNMTIIRDSLLPKLMSGKIRVKEAEEILEEVT